MKDNLEKFMNNIKKNKILYGIIGLVLGAIMIFLIVGQTMGKVKYTVSFDSNGGSNVESVVVAKNDTVPEPEDPTRDGYVFAGWYYNDELYDFDTPVVRDMVLEARWGTGVSSTYGIALNKTSLQLTVDDTYHFDVTLNLEDGSDKTLTWESSASDVVSVDSNGNVKALKEGTAIITVTTKDGKYTAKATVTVKAKPVVKVTGVTLNKTSLTLTEGESSKLVATVKPNDATNKGVTWKSSNSSVVSVDSRGNIKALKPGTATITVTTKDGNYTAKATVTVKAKPVVKVTGVTLNKTSLTLTEGESSKLVATVNPNNATNKGVTWSSSDSSVVSVDSNGNVRALKPGTATITVTTKDGNYTATCQITVNKKVASYSVIFTPVVQDVTNAVTQYSMTITRDSSTFGDFKFVIYNGTKVTNGHYLPLGKYDKNVGSATIRLSDGTDVTATVIYR